jgi:hypothetical protein
VSGRLRLCPSHEMSFLQSPLSSENMTGKVLSSTAIDVTATVCRVTSSNNRFCDTGWKNVASLSWKQLLKSRDEEETRYHSNLSSPEMVKCRIHMKNSGFKKAIKDRKRK